MNSLFEVSIASAQVPAFLSPGTSTSISEFIKGFYDFALIAAGVLAVGMIVVGGIYYSISGAVDKKGLGKEIIAGALWGLLLLLSAYVILRTVNPSLVDLAEPALEDVSFSQCTKNNFPDLPKCDYAKGNYWPISHETGKCICYADEEWKREYAVRKGETEYVTGPYNYTSNGQPPSQTGCCVNIDSKITLKWPKSRYKTDRGVNELLVRLYNTQGTKPWRVTAACPDTAGSHDSSCHFEPECTCVDIAINPPGSGNCDDWRKLIEASRSVGFSLLNETGCEGSVKTPKGTGPHIHLKLKK